MALVLLLALLGGSGLKTSEAAATCPMYMTEALAGCLHSAKGRGARAPRSGGPANSVTPLPGIAPEGTFSLEERHPLCCAWANLTNADHGECFYINVPLADCKRERPQCSADVL